jgi:hypothetical protein
MVQYDNFKRGTTPCIAPEVTIEAIVTTATIESIAPIQFKL